MRCGSCGCDSITHYVKRPEKSDKDNFCEDCPNCPGFT